MRLSLIISSLLLCQTTFPQPAHYRLTQQDYIAKYKDDAIKDMQHTGVPASITLAQGVLESESGNSDLAREANNHFGIKCHTDWTGGAFYKDDDEKNECFRKYNSVLESFDDHSKFLRTRDRYSFLFTLEITDYKGWAKGLKKAGYATNPDYANKLIKIIEDFQLNELDKGAKNLPIIAKAGGPPENGKSHVSRREKGVTVTQNYPASKNNVPYVIAKNGDSYFSIANANNMMLWQVLKYNDAEKTDSPIEGEIVYVKPKQSKAAEDFHIVKEGQDMRFIAQLYAVKMKKLYKRNHLNPGSVLTPGQKILLR